MLSTIETYGVSMKNLTVHATHAGNLNSIQNGNLAGNANLDDIGNLLDGMFMTELDSASTALLSQLAVSAKEGKPSKEPLDTNPEEPVQDVNPVNLMDAMQLAASQALMQSQVPQAQNDAHVDVPLTTGDNSVSSIGQGGDPLSANTIAGIANQNLLNILNGTVPQALVKTPLLDKASPKMDANAVNTTNSQETNPNQLPLEPLSSKQNEFSKLNPIDNQIQQGTKLSGEVNSVNIQATPFNPLQNQPALLRSVTKGDTAPSNKQAVNSGPSVKLANLSDALESYDGAKVLSVDQSTNNPRISQPFVINSNQSQAIGSEEPTIKSSVNDAVTKPLANQDTKEATTDKKSFDEFSGIATGFMLNPGFTNHVAHEANLKLEAANTSLTAGPLHGELMAAAKSGGGRISLEVNPDNAGPIRIDLQIDQDGQARLVVQGASESTQARLEQGGDQLRQQFAEMGLQLSLDMRQNSANNAFNQQTNDSTNQFSNNQSKQIIASGANSNRIGSEDLSGANPQSSTDNSNVINLFA